MAKSVASLLFVLIALIPILGQVPADQTDFKLALPNRQGQLQWHAAGFKIVESSAKPDGQEIGIRGKDESGRLSFLGFLFVVSRERSVTSAKCRDGEIDQLKRTNRDLRILATSEIGSSKDLPTELVTYSTKAVYSMRGFAATGDICGDLEFYSDQAINPDDPDLKVIFQSYRLEPSYVPQFKDVLLYGTLLYRQQMYEAAAPVFELALTKLTDDQSGLTMRRMTTDQAGMSYGISGDTQKARSIFQAALAKDPDYPMYYYNLACADAQEHKLADARIHLQQAFDRKANMLPGETFPDPTKDDSFLPYRRDKDFWKFVESLR
ncbi:MAG TPA: tetratricopeptide repeat protein [Candidatus Cybelea sp.]|nr:tetratricopeptide repeat protein [Candidatus Cybelea sp.]